MAKKGLHTYVRRTLRASLLGLTAALILSGCNGGTSWMYWMLGSAVTGGQLTKREQERQKLLEAQISRKYELENKRRAKLGRPPIEPPSQYPTEKNLARY